MSEKYRCIKDYYCYGNLAFKEGDGFQAILLTRLYTKFNKM